jgi:uncharacterized protein YjbI with pentapeptide repeats
LKKTRKDKLHICQYKFKSRYVGSSGNPIVGFPCTELTNGEFCIYHDKEQLAKNRQEVTEGFERKVSESISKNEPLECVGYYLPDIDFAKLLNDKTFAKPVNFTGATFSQEVNFFGATFSEGAIFSEATFSGEKTNFSKATFSGKADFGGTVFSKEVRFSRVSFSEAIFSDATFSGEANFHNATFSGEADFSTATFSGKAFFYDAIFCKKANFLDVKFSGEAHFLEATFSGGAEFSVTKFLDIARFEGSRFKVKTEFNKVLFEQPKKVTFDDSDLSKVSFANSDITRIIFGHKITWGGEKGFTIIEEEWLESKAKGRNKSEYTDVSLGLVLSVYRNLRESYEFRLGYDEAGEFFKKEMELKRKYREIKSDKIPHQIKENGWLRRNLLSLTGLYHLISSYGESVLRPTIIGGTSIAIPTLIWTVQNDEEWQNNLERSLSSFLPFLPFGSQTEIGIEDYFIKGAGALTFGLLIIALRRKFERKYTR